MVNLSKKSRKKNTTNFTRIDKALDKVVKNTAFIAYTKRVKIRYKNNPNLFPSYKLPVPIPEK